MRRRIVVAFLLLVAAHAPASSIPATFAVLDLGIPDPKTALGIHATEEAVQVALEEIASEKPTILVVRICEVGGDLGAARRIARIVRSARSMGVVLVDHLSDRGLVVTSLYPLVFAKPGASVDLDTRGWGPSGPAWLRTCAEHSPFASYVLSVGLQHRDQRLRIGAPDLNSHRAILGTAATVPVLLAQLGFTQTVEVAATASGRLRRSIREVASAEEDLRREFEQFRRVKKSAESGDHDALSKACSLAYRIEQRVREHPQLCVWVLGLKPAELPHLFSTVREKASRGAT